MITHAATRTSLRPTSGRLHTHGQRVSVGGRAVESSRRAAADAVRAERERLAHELHDSVAQTLYGVALSASRALALLERGDIEVVRGVLGEMLHLATDSQAQLRGLVGDLRSERSAHLERGLNESLAALAAGLEVRGGCAVHLSLAEEPALSPSTKETLFRIVREALRNCEKYAEATRVDLVLETGPSDVRLLVSDDGRGFDPHAARPGHFGLALMREQALAIGADLELVSSSGRGTQVRIRVGRRCQ
jgi:signal transduction histidine kinase